MRVAQVVPVLARLPLAPEREPAQARVLVRAQEQVQELPRVQELPQERAQELVLRVQPEPVQLERAQLELERRQLEPERRQLELAQPLQQRVLRAPSLASVSAQPLLWAWWVLRW